MNLRLAAVFATALAAGDLLAAAGTACILPSAECIAAEQTFAVAAADHERQFVWIDASRAELTFGTIAAGVSKVDAGASESRRLFLSLASGEFPITLTAGKWTFILTEPAAIRVVRVPRALTSLVVSAPRHRPVTLAIDKNAGDRIALGRIELQRYPTLAGRVVIAKSATPVVAASIESASGALLAQTAADGTFEIDIDAALAETWPTALHVSAAGYGRKLLPLADAPQPRQWSRVELTRGGAVRIRLNDERAEPAEVALELRRQLEQGAWESVGRNVTTAGAEPLLFSDLDPGKYVLTSSGREPLAQLATDVEVRAGEITDAAVDIAPIPVRIAVTHRGRNVENATLSISFNNRWSADVTARDGVYEGPLWQRGDLGAYAIIPESAAYWSRKSVESGSKVDWQIVVPDRSIHGRIRDRATGAPLPGIEVDLLRDGSGSTVTTDAAGAYRFDFLETGPVTVRVGTPNHLPAASQVQLGEQDHLRKVDFDLVPAVPTRIRFLMPDGSPAANARIYDPRLGGGESDEAGEVILPLAEGETRRLIAVPWQGAFTIFTATAQDQPLVVQFQHGPAKLAISAKDEASQPIAGLRFRVRYNGQDLPDDVLYWLAARDGNRVETGSDGVSILTGLPVGVYELWPVVSLRSNSASPAAAPVRLAAQAGDNPVRLTFTRW